MPFTCPVCGFAGLEEPPRSPSGGASYEICPSCSFQFGVSDEDKGISCEAWRARWISSGMPWDKGRSAPPRNWDPIRQLESVGVHRGRDT